MMALGNLYHSLALLSPKVEVALRKLYWDNVKYLLKFRNDFEPQKDEESGRKEQHIDFDKILDYLKAAGVQPDDIMVIHSSYDSLTPTGLSAEEIIDKLYLLVGKNGTLAMPAIREFPEEGQGKDYILSYIDNEMKDVETTYDVYRSKITSGLLPFTLMRYDDVEISHFPLNPLVAIGGKAGKIMEDNVNGISPSAHGPQSAWSHCAALNAWNIGIGVPEKDYLTMFHICQEDEEWPVKENEWYFNRKFIIKKGKTLTPLLIKERKHKWTKFFPEENFYNDLKTAGVLKHATIDGVEIYISRAKEMVNFIKKQPNPTYPYLIPSRYLKR